MDREILFRGKRTDNGVWVYGYFQVVNGYCYITIDGIPYTAIPETVGQYTELKDKHGEKIFEGDVVVINRVLLAKIVWYNGAFRCIELQSDNYNNIIDAGTLLRGYEVSIAGNIFDNPELLK